MANASTVPVAQVAVATPATKAQPARLTQSEKWLAGLLIAGGIVLIVLLLSAFMARSDAWSLKSKESTETTAATADAPEKTTTATEYSDSVVIAALGIGSLLVICGAFYGRIREITLPGGVVVKLDAPPGVEESVAKTAEKVAQSEDGITQPELEKEAQATAPQLLAQDLLSGLPPSYSDDLAQRAVSAAVQRIRRQQ